MYRIISFGIDEYRDIEMLEFQNPDCRIIILMSIVIDSSIWNSEYVTLESGIAE